jgi:hypothetical protein
MPTKTIDNLSTKTKRNDFKTLNSLDLKIT